MIELEIEQPVSDDLKSLLIVRVEDNSDNIKMVQKGLISLNCKVIAEPVENAPTSVMERSVKADVPFEDQAGNLFLAGDIVVLYYVGETYIPTKSFPIKFKILRGRS